MKNAKVKKKKQKISENIRRNQVKKKKNRESRIKKSQTEKQKN